MNTIRGLSRKIIAAIVLGMPPIAWSQIPPSIITQPEDVVADFASDVAFSVSATGTEPLSYQWWNGDHRITDYDPDAAGAQTATLYLVGVGQENSSWEGQPSYHVVITNIAGAVTSYWAGLTVRPKVVLSDNFENGLGQWSPLLDAAPLAIDSSHNRTPNGAFSAAISNSSQKMYCRLAPKQDARLRMTMWIYDAGGPQTVYGELRGYTGETGYAKYIWKGLWQSLAAGIYSTDFGTNNTGSLAGETLNPTNYQGRVMTGNNTGWFNLNAPGAPTRSQGWHKFQIERSKSGTNVDFYVDDMLARNIIGAKEGVALDTVTIGSTGTGESNQLPVVPVSGWIDDITVESYQNNGDQETLALQGSIPELMQLRETGTNATVVNVSPTTVYELRGASTNSGAGSWAAKNSEIVAGDVRGSVEYSVRAPADNAYRVEIEGREKDFKWPRLEMSLIVSLDGEELGRVTLPYGPSSNGLAHCFTPFIRAGTHTLRIFWDNARPRCEVALHAIRLQALNGRVATNNGMSMWVANRLLAQCGMDSVSPASLVSPMCLEGRGSYLSMMKLQAGPDAMLNPVPIHHGAGSRWYANVPLSPVAPTEVEVSYQNGGLTESNEITWEVTDLFTATNMTIRKGDSLLLTALPEDETNGPVTIQVEGQDAVNGDGSEPVPVLFNTAGTYLVTGLYEPTGATASIAITVVDASFNGPCPANQAVWWSWWTYWDCTNLPPGVILDSDSRLAIYPVSAAERAARLTNAAPLGANGREYKIEGHSPEPRYVVARLGTNGPILADTAILGYQLFAPPSSSFRVASTQADGSQVIEGTYVLSPVVPGFGLSLGIATAGVTFDDGTLSRNLTTNDFDELGVCRVNFIRAAGVEGGACMQAQLQPDTH